MHTYIHIFLYLFGSRACTWSLSQAKLYQRILFCFNVFLLLMLPGGIPALLFFLTVPTQLSIFCNFELYLLASKHFLVSKAGTTNPESLLIFLPSSTYCFLFVLLFLMLRIKLWDLCLIRKHCTTELCPSPLAFVSACLVVYVRIFGLQMLQGCPSFRLISALFSR